jgi:pilus assembly protein Flp/PilA
MLVPGTLHPVISAVAGGVALFQPRATKATNEVGNNGWKHMSKYFKRLSRRIRKQSGQSLVEYALILALIAVVAILVLQGLGQKVNNTLSTVNGNLP